MLLTDPHRAAIVTSGIAEVAACNDGPPFCMDDRVPEVTLQHLELAALSVGFGQVMGVVA